ncbi:MAG: formylglycine-generating enzyme family protein [Bacteroidales bacterium]|nr:formylglycine-generating enzyme family protein [Bacteroidales bacterium]MBN2757599.1 formylglycine-generating enzyme family protein [Bacteroidales bacterium]
METVLVQGGTFVMGNDYSINTDEAPEHKVTLSDFEIGKYEVTFSQFDQFCISTGWEKPDDAGLGRDNNPVMNISWESAVMYCNWLSKMDGLDRCYTIRRDSLATIVLCDYSTNGYRLPTEAEWEYAAKGGNKSNGFSYSGSNNPDEVAWYYSNSAGRPHTVGTKKANELGIFDMNGNVREWVWDLYEKDYYSKSPESNPTGPADGVRRVFRGGGWSFKVGFLRLTARGYMGPNKSYGNVGFRVVKKP